MRYDDVADALVRMGRARDATLTPEIAREMALLVRLLEQQ